MNTDRTNKTQIEELDDDQLQDAQGGFKAIDGLGLRQTEKDSSELLLDGLKTRIDNNPHVVAGGGGNDI